MVRLAVAGVVLSALVVSVVCGGSSDIQPTTPSPPAAPVLTSVGVTVPSLSLIIGKTVQARATAVFGSGPSQDVTSRAVWSTSNSVVATVDGAGVITAAGQGVVQIAATYSERSGSATVTVAGVIGDRTSFDRPDDDGGYQFKFLYVVPSDGIDEQLDVRGVISTSVEAFQNWLAGQSDGRRFRTDTYAGQLDIAFVRLQSSDAQLANTALGFTSELHELGFNARNKIYAVYYGGSNANACGQGPWPAPPGGVAGLYLRGTPPGAPPCASNPFAASPFSPGYFEFGMAHELMHTLGAVPSCAPHFALTGHVSDDPTDLMYAGSLAWRPSQLDLGHDDYFLHGRADCLDVMNSAFLDPSRPGATPPPGWPSATQTTSSSGFGKIVN